MPEHTPAIPAVKSKSNQPCYMVNSRLVWGQKEKQKRKERGREEQEWDQEWRGEEEAAQENGSVMLAKQKDLRLDPQHYKS